MHPRTIEFCIKIAAEAGKTTSVKYSQDNYHAKNSFLFIQQPHISVQNRTKNHVKHMEIQTERKKRLLKTLTQTYFFIFISEKKT